MNTPNTIKDGMDFMAELYNQANADATATNISDEQRTEHLLMAEAFAHSFAFLHRHWNPKIVDGTMGVTQEEQGSAQLVSLSAQQLCDICHKAKTVAKPADTVHIFYDAHELNVFLMDDRLTVIPIHTAKTPQ